VRATARVLRAGGRLATLGFELRDAGGGLLATATHVKFMQRGAAGSSSRAGGGGGERAPAPGARSRL